MNEPSSEEGSEPAPEQPEEFVHYLEAFFVWCPYCQARVLVTSSRREAEEALRLGVPDPANYSEAVPVGAGKNVHFLQCGSCGRAYVARMYLTNPEAFSRYDALRKYHPHMEKPKEKWGWGGVPFIAWMREVLANPNAFVRMKAMKECERRGIRLPWNATAASHP